MWCDNIEFDAQTNSVTCGITRDLGPVFGFLAGINNRKEIDGMAMAAGGAVLAHLPSAENNAWVVYPDFVVNDDPEGAMMLQTSAAVRYGSRVLMGSPLDHAVLVCDVDFKKDSAKKDEL